MSSVEYTRALFRYIGRLFPFPSKFHEIYDERYTQESSVDILFEFLEFLQHTKSEIHPRVLLRYSCVIL